MPASSQNITSQQAAHAHKVAQKIADYHSKMPISANELIKNPSADIGIFNKLAPELRNKIYQHLFEDVFQPDLTDTLCHCRLSPGECDHVGHEVYKPLNHLRPLLSIASTCRLFRAETQALLFVDYVPKASWVAWGERGLNKMRKFLHSIRGQDHAKMQFAWRNEDANITSLVFPKSQEKPISIATYPVDWLSLAIDRHEFTKIFPDRILNRRARPFGAPHTWAEMTRRFYYGHHYVPAWDSETVVVNGPLQILFWKFWQEKEWDEESQQRYERIVRM